MHDVQVAGLEKPKIVKKPKEAEAEEVPGKFLDKMLFPPPNAVGDFEDILGGLGFLDYGSTETSSAQLNS